MAGGLSAAQSDAGWIITSYLAANAVVLPIIDFRVLGERNLAVSCVIRRDYMVCHSGVPRTGSYAMKNSRPWLTSWRLASA
jgi:hypothetical protein